MDIKVYTVKLDTPPWLRRIIVYLAIPAAAILSVSAIVYADVALPHTFHEGDTLSASTMNENFVALQDAIAELEGRANRQVVLGELQTVAGKRTNSSPGPFDLGTPSVAFAPPRSARYRVYGDVLLAGPGGCNWYARIVASEGAPTILHQQTVSAGLSDPTLDAQRMQRVELLVELEADIHYTFTVEASAGTCDFISIRSDLLVAAGGSGTRLVAEEL